MPPNAVPGPSRSSSASASAMLFESQGSMMLRMAMGGNSLQNETDVAGDSSSSSGDIRLRQLRESQLEEFPTTQSVQLNLETSNGAEQSYASPSRIVRVPTTSSSDKSVQELPGAVQVTEENVNDPQRRTIAETPNRVAPLPPRVPPPPPVPVPRVGAAAAARIPEMPPPKVPEKSVHAESRQHATPKRRSSLESVDSFIGDQEPRNAGDYIRQRTRAEEEAERFAKQQRGFHSEAPRSTHPPSPSKRPQVRDEKAPSKENDMGNCVVNADGDSASSLDSWNKMPPSPKLLSVDNGASVAQGHILVQGTPTNTNTSPSRSSGISASFSQQPAPLVPNRYPPGTGPSDPPFMRPTSSLDTSSRPWTETSQHVSDHPERHTQQSLSGPSLEDGPSSSFAPATPERRNEGAPAANILVTPTQPSIAPAPRLRAREVDADTLSRMRSNTTGSELAARSLGSDDVVPETRDNSGADAADDGVKVDVLLPAFIPTSRAKGVGDAHPEHGASDRPPKRRRTDVEPPRNENDSQGGPESPTPAELSEPPRTARRASPVSASLPVTPIHGSKVASMKRKAPSSPPNDLPLPSSSADIPLASLPDVEKGRGRKSSMRENIKMRQKQRFASPHSENEAESDETEHSDDEDDDDDDEGSNSVRGEAGVPQAVPEASGTEEEVSESSGSSVEEPPSSPEKDDDADDDYVYDESQIPGSGQVDGFGIKRKRGSYASVSPAKSSRKRARMRAEQETSPTKGKSASKSVATANINVLHRPEVLRVFAPWHRNNQFYLGRVVARTKKGEYEVLFDDGEMSHVPLAKLRSEVIPGDRVKVMSHQGQWAEVTSVTWRKRGGQYITAKIAKSRESVTIQSQFILVPKDTWPQDRHISLKDIPETITKAIQSPLHLRSKHTSGIEQPPTPTKVKPEPNPVVSRKLTSVDQQRKVPSSSRGAKLKSRMSATSFAGSDAVLPPVRVPPSQIKQAFARTIIMMTGIEEKLKASLIPRIRRGGGKIVEDWPDIISIGNDRSGMQWRGIAKEGGVDQILLLSREANQFSKYMMALAIGVPCISIQWVLDRLEGVDVNWHGYLHIAGKLERTGQLVSQVFDPRWGSEAGKLNDLTPVYPVRQPFQNLGFLLVFSSKQGWKLRQDAQRVICAAGAASAELVTSVDQAKEPIDSYDFVVADTENKTFIGLLQSAGAKTCVNTAWVRQCIIAGALQPV